jgi:hypothetical protein
VVGVLLAVGYAAVIRICIQRTGGGGSTVSIRNALSHALINIRVEAVVANFGALE